MTSTPSSPELPTRGPRVFTFTFPHLLLSERRFVLRENANTVGFRLFALKWADTIKKLNAAETDADFMEAVTPDFLNDLMRAFLIGNHDGIDWLYDLSPLDFERNVPAIFNAMARTVNRYITDEGNGSKT